MNYRLTVDGKDYMVNVYGDNINVRQRVMPENRLYYLRYIKPKTKTYKKVMEALRVKLGELNE